MSLAPISDISDGSCVYFSHAHTPESHTAVQSRQVTSEVVRDGLTWEKKCDICAVPFAAEGVKKVVMTAVINRNAKTHVETLVSDMAREVQDELFPEEVKSINVTAMELADPDAALLTGIVESPSSETDGDGGYD